LRGKFRSDHEGTYYFKSVLPKGYQIPTDGPVSDLMRTTGRSLWCPAHIHFMVSAEGYKPLTTPWNQSWTGTDQVRFYKLNGITLTITTARAQSPFDGEEGEFILVWKKVQ
jgi:Dioxygenase/Lipocalin-like domain